MPVKMSPVSSLLRHRSRADLPAHLPPLPVPDGAWRSLGEAGSAPRRSAAGRAGRTRRDSDGLTYDGTPLAARRAGQECWRSSRRRSTSESRRARGGRNPGAGARTVRRRPTRPACRGQTRPGPASPARSGACGAAPSSPIRAGARRISAGWRRRRAPTPARSSFRRGCCATPRGWPGRIDPPRAPGTPPCRPSTSCFFRELRPDAPRSGAPAALGWKSGSLRPRPSICGATDRPRARSAGSSACRAAPRRGLRPGRAGTLPAGRLGERDPRPAADDRGAARDRTHHPGRLRVAGWGMQSGNPAD